MIFESDYAVARINWETFEFMLMRLIEKEPCLEINGTHVTFTLIIPITFNKYRIYEIINYYIISFNLVMPIFKLCCKRNESKQLVYFNSSINMFVWRNIHTVGSKINRARGVVIRVKKLIPKAVLWNTWLLSHNL